MLVEKIELKCFRNYQEENVEFGQELNLVCGQNAQGKTNLIEAILFCCIGKSFRATKENQLIKFGENIAKITLHIRKKFTKTVIEVFLPREGKKSIKINGIPISKIGDLMGELNAVFFSPEELKLIKEKPEDRRRFIDIDISQTSKAYFYLLGRYEKILANRNKLLKNGQSQKSVLDTIIIWDMQLAKTASEIIMFRQKFINDLNPICQKAHSYLTGKKETINIEYTGIVGETAMEIEAKILQHLKKSFDKEFSLGYTTIGPHRDDLKITINDIDVRYYGSQGQQRTAALAIKLAEIEIINQKTGEMPILLLDDVLSELDDSRKSRLMAFCKKTQTILTTAESINSPVALKTTEIVILNGKVNSLTQRN